MYKMPFSYGLHGNTKFSRNKKAASQISKLYHLKNRYKTSFCFYGTKQGGGIKYMTDKGDKNGVKDEDTKKMKPRSISVFRSFGISNDEVQYNRKGM